MLEEREVPKIVQTAMDAVIESLHKIFIYGTTANNQRVKQYAITMVESMIRLERSDGTRQKLREVVEWSKSTIKQWDKKETTLDRIPSTVNVLLWALEKENPLLVRLSSLSALPDALEEAKKQRELLRAVDDEIARLILQRAIEDDEHEMVRSAAVWVLGKLAHSELIPEMVMDVLLSDSSQMVRFRAAEALVAYDMEKAEMDMLSQLVLADSEEKVIALLWGIKKIAKDVAERRDGLNRKLQRYMSQSTFQGYIFSAMEEIASYS